MRVTVNGATFEVLPIEQHWFLRFWPKSVAAITLGKSVYMRARYFDPWNAQRRDVLLAHEAAHVRDQGPLFWLTYFLLPIGPSLKAYWEWRGYKETLRAEKEVYGYVSANVAEMIVRAFLHVGPPYFWMWPFERYVRRLIAQEIAALES